MNRRDVVGKKIVSVQQYRFWDDNIGKMQTAVCAIRLDNGTSLVFGVCETSYDMMVTSQTIKKKKEEA